MRVCPPDPGCVAAGRRAIDACWNETGASNIPCCVGVVTWVGSTVSEGGAGTKSVVGRSGMSTVGWRPSGGRVVVGRASLADIMRD